MILKNYLMNITRNIKRIVLFEIRVKKGLERKMLRALKKHFLMSSDTLKRYITTF